MLDRTDLTKIFRIDPLVIAGAHFFYVAVLDELLALGIKHLFCIQLLCTHHPTISVEYFFVVSCIHIGNPF